MGSENPPLLRIFRVRAEYNAAMAYLELDRTAFYNNLDIIAQQTRGADKIALVLKDNAYGHGLEEMAALAAEYGIGRAVVRNVVEGRIAAAFFGYVLVLAQIPESADERLCFTLNTLEEIGKFPRGCRVEIKCDSGMHRNGVTPEELEAAFKGCAEAGLRVEGIFTHFRSADTLSSEWFWQKKGFEAFKKEARELAGRYGFAAPRVHSCNSAALFRCEHFDEDMARVGIAAYGALEMEAGLKQPALRPVMSLYAEKIATRTLQKGERVGYNGIFEAADAMRVSTYDVGYADGLLRGASNRYCAPCGAALLGRISMDNVTFASEAERLLVFNDANAFAASAGTIGYEVMVGMRPQMRRIVKR